MSALQAQAAERRKRLEFLKSKGSKNQLQQSGHLGDEQSSPNHATYSSYSETSPEAAQAADLIQANEYPSAIKDNTSETIGFETAEVLSAQIQDQILSKFESGAISALSESRGIYSKPERIYEADKEDQKFSKPTSDLEEKLRPDLDILQQRTDEAIKRLVRQRLMSQTKG